MEQGAWDEANKVKQELEERQRARRKMREAEVAQRKEKGKWQKEIIDIHNIHISMYTAFELRENMVKIVITFKSMDYVTP